MGVCSCKNQPNIDELCNQDCRAKQPTYTFVSGTKLNVTIEGKTTTVDLVTDTGREVFGTVSNTNGNIRTVQMGTTDGGFVGSYSAPSFLTDIPEKQEVVVQVAATNTTKVVKKPQALSR